MKTMCVYVLRDPRTFDVRYVGAALDASQRLKAHLAGKTPSNRAWVLRLAAEGLIPHLQVMAYYPVDQARKEERALWDHYRELGEPLLNRRPNSWPVEPGGTLSDRHRQNLRVPRSKRSPEHCEKIRQRMLGNRHGEGRLGLKASAETIEKLRVSHLGKKLSPETIEKLRISHMGNKSRTGQKSNKTPEELREIALRAWVTRRARSS